MCFIGSLILCTRINLDIGIGQKQIFHALITKNPNTEHISLRAFAHRFSDHLKGKYNVSLVTAQFQLLQGKHVTCLPFHMFFVLKLIAGKVKIFPSFGAVLTLQGLNVNFTYLTPPVSHQLLLSSSPLCSSGKLFLCIFMFNAWLWILHCTL